MRKDLSGQVFGKLTAVKPLRSEKGKGIIWHCECQCGEAKEVSASRLLRGNAQSCGCIRKGIRSKWDITGKRWGRLEAVKFIFRDEKYKDYWLFVCDCGNEKILQAASVKWGGTRSCGCLAHEHVSGLKKQNIAGQKFDRLTAISPTQERDAAGSVVWECRCDCGNIAHYSVMTLKQGKVHSCGCLYRESRAKCTSYRRDFSEGTSLSSLVVSKEPRNNNTSGCTGVYLDKKRNLWSAYINFQKKRYHLGTYKKKEDAIKARKRAEKKFHDPILMEKLNQMTEETRSRFMKYLSGLNLAQQRKEKHTMKTMDLSQSQYSIRRINGLYLLFPLHPTEHTHSHVISMNDAGFQKWKTTYEVHGNEMTNAL